MGCKGEFLRCLTTILSCFVLLMMTFTSWSQKSKVDFEHYKVDVNAKKIDFFNAIESIELTGLEETEDSYIGELSGYVSYPGGIIIPDYKNKVVLIFDEAGQFKHLISNSGPGPRQYSGFGTPWISDDQVVFYDGKRKNQHWYSLDGQLKKINKAKVPNEWWTGSMFPLGEGYISHMIDPSMTVHTRHTAVILDKDLNLLHTLEKKSPRVPFAVNLGKRFSSYDNLLYYRAVMEDTIFRVMANSLVPAIKLDLGKDWLWSDPIYYESIGIASDIIINDDSQVFEALPDVGPDFITLTYYWKLRIKGKGIIHRANKQFYPFKLLKKDRTNFDLNFLRWESGKLVSYIQTYDLEEFMAKLKPGQWTVNGGWTIDDLLGHENPVLLKIKFKPDLGLGK